MISPLFFEDPEQLCIDEQTRVDEVFIQTHYCSGCDYKILFTQFQYKEKDFKV